MLIGGIMVNRAFMMIAVNAANITGPRSSLIILALEHDLPSLLPPSYPLLTYILHISSPLLASDQPNPEGLRAPPVRGEVQPAAGEGVGARSCCVGQLDLNDQPEASTAGGENGSVRLQTALTPVEFSACAEFTSRVLPHIMPASAGAWSPLSTQSFSPTRFFTLF